ncbi:MAG: hypothetical protein ACJAVI_001689 [Candidatus Azotimanducaceae bacterium]|jgi:hypothetical protein
MNYKNMILTAIFTLTTTSTFAEDNVLIQGVVEATGMGTVDLSKTQNKIQAKLLAKRAARVDAQRNLLEMVEGVRVTSGTTVKDAQLESDLVANRVKGLLRGAFVVEENIIEEDGDLLAEVKLGLCIDASLSECKARPKLSQILLESLQQTELTSFKPESNAPVAVTAEKITGLIINLEGRDFDPFLGVRLVTGKGEEIYGPSHFKSAKGADWIHWAATTAEALGNSEVVGDSPLQLSAAGISSEANVVLSNEAAVRVYQSNLNNQDFLSQGRVILVLGTES